MGPGLCFVFYLILSVEHRVSRALGWLLSTTPLRMTLNFSPSCFYCGPLCLVCIVLETEPWTSRMLGKHSTKGAACPSLFCFLSTARETQGFPHTEHKQQGLFGAIKCSLLIAGTPFLASVCWEVADRTGTASELTICHKQVLTVAGVAFPHTTHILQRIQRVALVFPVMWLPRRRLGMSHFNGTFWVNKEKHTTQEKKLGICREIVT